MQGKHRTWQSPRPSFSALGHFLYLGISSLFKVMLFQTRLCSVWSKSASAQSSSAHPRRPETLRKGRGETQQQQGWYRISWWPGVPLSCAVPCAWGLSPLGTGCYLWSSGISIQLHLCFWGLGRASSGLVRDNRKMLHLSHFWNQPPRTLSGKGCPMRRQTGAVSASRILLPRYCAVSTGSALLPCRKGSLLPAPAGASPTAW